LGTLALNMTAFAANFIIVLLLTHLLGANAFGSYASAIAWSALLAVVAVLGLAPMVVRNVASYSRTESWALLRGLLRWTNQAVGISSFATVVAGAILGWITYAGRPELLHPFLVALALVPLTAFTSLRQAAMQGLGRVVAGRIPETVLVPALFIGATLLAKASGYISLTPAKVTMLQVLATCGGFVVGAFLLRRSLPAAAKVATRLQDRNAWRRSARSLVVLNVVGVAGAQVGTIMLGALATPEDAGVYNVALRVTTFISFVMVAATYALSPAVARLHVEGDTAGMQRITIRAARLVLLASIPVALVLIVFAEPILSLFGPDFTAGSTAVRILAVGDLVNVLTGFGGVALVMSGFERELALSVGVGAVCSVGLTAALVPVWGVNGAAVATATALAVSNVAMTWLAWRRLGVWTAVLAMPRQQPV
jgi:O-antigen/teichoic acid export membrane protein